MNHSQVCAVSSQPSRARQAAEAGISRSDPLATRMQRVDIEARRLTDLGATLTGALSEDGLDHYAVGMKDPEGNEFDIN
jgi:hypothetical protein